MEVQSPDPFGFIVPESMPVRRFFAKFMLAVPALMTLAVTVQSKSSGDPGHVKPANAELNRRISAYVPLMRQMAKYQPPNNGELTPKAARVCAQLWIRHSEEGRIMPLFLTEYADSITNGVTGQIVQSNWQISRALVHAAEQEAHRGATKLAAEDALRSIEVDRILGTSDPTTSSVANLRTRRACAVLKAISGKLSQTERAKVALELKRLQPNRQRFAEMIEGMYQLYRLGAIADPQMFRKGNGHVPPPVVVRDVLRPVFDSSAATHGVWQHDSFLTLAKRSVSSETVTNREFDKTLETYAQDLNGPKG